MTRSRRAWALLRMASLGAAASCDAVLGIEAYGPGPPGEAGADAGEGVEGSTDAPGEGGACTSGDKRCAGDAVVSCDGNGAWGRANPCPAGKTCSGGACHTTPPSCATGGPGMTTCGPHGAGTESCCTTRQDVPSGSFDRSYDGLSMGYESRAYPATVSAFRLDAYEITVGRFRSFVEAVTARGWLPAPGSGKHAHLNGGRGVVGTGGGFETGWDGAWNGTLATTATEWDAHLSGGTWTPGVGAHENDPITEIDWNEAYAFCIFDGGFLPTEAEWNDAAAGGADQRARPFSTAYPPGSTTMTCANANFSPCPPGRPNAVGSESPAGDGKWGHSDLAGNVWEWTLDGYAPYASTCVDCANLSPGTSRVLRGGSFHAASELVLTSNRFYENPTQRAYDVGARCARSP